MCTKSHFQTPPSSETDLNMADCPQSQVSAAVIHFVIYVSANKMTRQVLQSLAVPRETHLTLIIRAIKEVC